jgi:hypothetical protein
MIIKLTMTDQYPAYLSGFYMMFLRGEMLECTTHFVVSSARPYMLEMLECTTLRFFLIVFLE